MRIAGWVSESIPVPPRMKQDVLLLLALYTFNCLSFSAWVKLGQVPSHPWLLLEWLYGLAALIPLLWRDRAPMTVLGTQWVFTVAAWPMMPHYIPAVGIPVALYAVSVQCSRKISFLALLTSFIPSAVAAAASYKTAGVNSLVTNGVFFFVSVGWAWGLGRLTQAGRRNIQVLERERESAWEAEVLAAERRRIARELHDIVSHAVTLIVLQAAGAARVAETDFAQVTRSLGHIETAGKQAMAELRRLLGVLSDSDPGSAVHGIDGLQPQPGLADLTELLASLRAAGMPVTMQVTGIPRELDSSLDLTAYRIVQEGLVNVLKHAGKDANPRLQLIWKPHSLLIQIDNDMNVAKRQAGQPLSGGRGLVGLRERAHAAGGDLDAGPCREGGFRLTATIPFATPGVSSVPRVASQGRGEQGKVLA